MRFVKTCDACPEQYDVFQGKRQVGYIRLRGGRFRVECPDVGEETVFVHVFEGQPLMGEFDDAEQRTSFLEAAEYYIREWMKRNHIH